MQSTVRGQPMFEIGYQGPWPPIQTGQWEGPYDLGNIITEGGGPNPANPEGEIAHAVFIPSGLYAGQVHLWCWPHPEQLPYNPRSYIWDPDSTRPINATPITGAWTKSSDIFCASHSFRSNGDMITTGGRDFTIPGTHPIGAEEVFVFRHDTGMWELSATAFMDPPRFYPTSVRYGDDLYIVGHTGQQPAGSGINTEETWHRLVDGPSPFVEFPRLNETYDPDDPDCGEDARISIHDYGKVILLPDRSLMWVDGEVRNPSGDDMHFGWFLPLDTLPCPTQGEPFRWLQGENSGHEAQHAGGGVAYYVFLDDDGTATSSVVYVMGGTEHGNDDGNDCEGPVIAMAERMINPSRTATWDDAGVPDMKVPRYNANAVVLLDGSLLMIGGQGLDSTGACTSWLRPERFEPFEVFGADHVDEWRLLAPHQEARNYHSCAALLPDGRVVVAGGKGGPHTVEVFRPQYMASGIRPEISAVVGNVRYGNTIDVVVTLAAEGPLTGIDRVALLSPSSTTHTASFDQRYVQLSFDEENPPTGTGPYQHTLQVTLPAEHRFAPPGYYLLTVVDTADVPSPAVVVQLLDP